MAGAWKTSGSTNSGNRAAAMEAKMMRNPRAQVVAAGLLGAALAATPSFAQKSGGVFKVFHWDSPASMSILEEATYSTVVPMMGVFNNLIMYDQHVPQNSMNSIVPDLATSWSWNEEGTELSFKLRQDVKWHDGKPFTAADVKCTFDLVLGKAKDKLRINPRKAWYHNVKEVTANGDFEAVFHLERPQPALVTLLASATRPSIPATCRHATCARTRSAPARSNLLNSSRTNGSKWPATPIIGKRIGPISTALNTRSSPTARPHFSPSKQASST
jgi:peptide/nickel transport system substrate-binding protein